MQITQNAALYSLLGTQFGGNGTTTFQLPDLRGRVFVSEDLVGPNTGITDVGQAGGSETVTLTIKNLPAHIHTVVADGADGVTGAGESNYFAKIVPSTATLPVGNLYGSAANLVALAPAVVGSSGGSGAHNNMQPFLVVRYYICTSGYYPTRS